MTTAYTSLLGLALPVTGELSGTWGDTVNNSITSLLDTSVAGTTNVSTDTDVTLTTTTGAANTARQAILLFSGARTALRTVTAPAQSKVYTVINATTGGFSVKLVGVGPTTGVTIVAGESAVCAWNGSDFVKVSNTSGSGTFTNLTVTGNLTVNSLTATRVPYASTSGLLVDSANMTFNGTTLTAGGLTTTGATSTGTLSASGVATFSAGTVSLPAITTTGDTNTGIYFPAADTIAFTEGGAESMRIDSSGNVGIGTSSPANKLEISGGNIRVLGTSTGRITFNNGATEAFLGFNGAGLTNLDSGALPLAIGTQGANYIALSTNSTERARITSGGQFLFGTTTENLSRWGRANFYYPSSTSNATISLQNGTARASGNKYGILFADNTDESNAAVYVNQNSSGNNGADLLFGTNSGTGGAGLGNVTERMRITSGGDVGINTTSTGARLDVACGSSADAISIRGRTSDNFGLLSFATSAGVKGAYLGSSDSTNLIFYTNGFTERMRLDSSGNLGIGTTSPSATAKVTVRDASYGLYRAENTVGGYAQFGVTSNASSNGYLDSSNAFLFNTDATERMRLTSTGLGIGNTAPTTRLEITGSGTALSSMVVSGSSATNNLIKYGFYATKHYTNATAPLGLVCGETQSAANIVRVGGGYGEVTAATSIEFYTAANNTTVTGSERARIDSSGNFALGASSANGMRFYAMGYSPEIYDPTTYSAKFAYYPKGSQEAYEISTGSTLKAGYGTLINISVNDNNGSDQVYYGAVAQSAGNSGANFVFGRRTGTQTWAESARIDSSGNLLVGTSSLPSGGGIVTASSSAAETKVSIVNTGTGGRHYWIGSSNNSSGSLGGGKFAIFDQTATASRMVIDSNGDLMVGGTSPLQSAKITAYGAVAAQNGAVDGGYQNAFVSVYSGNTNEHNVIKTAVSSVGAGSGFQFKASNGGGSSSTTTVLELNRTQTIFYTDGGERARITSGGQFLIGGSSTAGQEKLRVTGTGVTGTSFAARFNQNNTSDGSATLIGLSVEGSTWSKGAIGFVRRTSFDVGDLVFCSNASTSTSDVTLSDERMRLTYEGTLLVGTTSNGTGIDTGSTRLFVVAPNSNFGAALTTLSDNQGRNIRLSDQSKTITGALDAGNSKITFGSNTAHPLTFITSGTEKARIDTSGNLLVGSTSGSNHQIKKAVSVGSAVLEVIGNNTGCVFYNGDGGTPNAANAVLKVTSVGATGRSINAAGTINASGADYAEYMTKAGSFTVAKGDVVGIDAQGKLTNVYADAVSFVVKSTDPSYVGNDKWGGGIEGDELEAARQTVDRIAFAGQVPVNVLGASAGQYIVPINDNGAIKGQAVSNPTFEQYQSSVGKVIAIEADGRARIIVKVA